MAHKPMLSKIHHVRSKPIRCLLLQFDSFSIIQGVLHLLNFQGLMMKFSNSFFLFLCVIKLSNHFMMTMVIKVFSAYWICYITNFIGLLCLQILTIGFPNAERYLVGKGDYTEPKTLQGSLVAHQLLELLLH